MINRELLNNIQDCIKIYDQKEGSDYLIGYKKGKSAPLEFCQITFHHYNFWHLMGCLLKATSAKSGLDIYNMCKNGEDISDYLSLVHSYAEANLKTQIFCKTFDFVQNAKMIKLGIVNDCPEQFYLTMALGNSYGIVGYGNDRKSNILIPKTVQDKKISTVSTELQKILFILSKRQTEKFYTKVEYEIKKEIIKEYLTEIEKMVTINIT